MSSTSTERTRKRRARLRRERELRLFDVALDDLKTIDDVLAAIAWTEPLEPYDMRQLEPWP